MNREIISKFLWNKIAIFIFLQIFLIVLSVFAVEDNEIEISLPLPELIQVEEENIESYTQRIDDKTSFVASADSSEKRKIILCGVYGDRGELNVGGFYGQEWKSYTFGLRGSAFEREDFSKNRSFKGALNFGVQYVDYGRFVLKGIYERDSREAKNKGIEQRITSTEAFLDVRRQRDHYVFNFGIWGGYKNFDNQLEEWDNNYTILEGDYSTLWREENVVTFSILFEEDRIKKTTVQKDDYLQNLKGNASLSYKWIKFKKLHLGGDLKFEAARSYNEEDEFLSMPNVSIFWQLRKNLALSVNLSSQLQPASFHKLYKNETFVQINPNLINEKHSWVTNLGFSWYYRKMISLELSYKYSEIFNKILWRNDNDFTYTIYPFNLTEKLELHEGFFTIEGNLGFFRYYFNSDLILSSNMERLPHLPELTGTAKCDIILSENSYITTEASYIGKRYVDMNLQEDEENRLNDYFVISTDFRQKIKDWEFSIKVENIANNKFEHYKGWEDGGRKFIFEVLWDF